MEKSWGYEVNFVLQKSHGNIPKLVARVLCRTTLLYDSFPFSPSFFMIDCKR